MTIKYSNQNAIRNIYSEVFEIMLQKKKILKNRTRKIIKFNVMNPIRMIISGIIFLLSDIFFQIYEVNNDIRIIWSVLILIYVAITFHNQRVYLKNLKKLEQDAPNHKGELTITKDSITDKSNDMEINVALEKVTCIFVGKYSINIFTDNFIHFYLPINIKEDVITTIKKYKKDIQIIESTEK